MGSRRIADSLLHYSPMAARLILFMGVRIVAGYCTACGGTGFRKPSREYKGRCAYVRRILALSPADIGAELERLQKIIKESRS